MHNVFDFIDGFYDNRTSCYVAIVFNTAPKKVNCIVNDQHMPNKIRK